MDATRIGCKSFPTGRPNDFLRSSDIVRMWAACFIEDMMNVARHSQRGRRMIGSPRRISRASRLNGSVGNVA